VRSPRRGELWLVDLGLAAKIRPCVVLSVPATEADRSLVTVVPHTTSLRGTRFEVAVSVPFLRTGAFDAQGIVTVPTVRLMRHLGTLKPEQLNAIVSGVCLWLGINVGS
jgi:Growth inhibitor